MPPEDSHDRAAAPTAIDRRRLLGYGLGGAALAGSGIAAAAARTPSPALTDLTLAAASRLVRGGQLSPVALTEACLARIDRYDPLVNAFITVTADTARAQARIAEAEIAAGRWRGPLHGIPLALKDNIDTAGVRTTAASAVYADRVPTRDAEVVRRLKASGAVLLGKLNLGEFAISESVVSAFGPVHNPWNLSRETGGSSSGAGAAVAAGFCFGALGTDTAGSVRMPAAHCGVVGLKPSYGLVSNRGTIPLMDSLDHVGPLARSVEDIALLLAAIAGPDPDWAGSIDPPARDYTALLAQPVSGFRIGIASAPFLDMATPDIAAAFAGALVVLRGLAGAVRPVMLPPSQVDVMALFAAEAYGYHRPLLKLHRFDYQPSNRKLFDAPEAKNGWDAAADYADARTTLRAERRAIGRVFDDIDLIVLPTLRYEPRDNAKLLAEVNAGGGIMPSNTRPFDVLGLPAISVPCGFTRDGMPIGLQIVGGPRCDDKVMAMALAYQRATPWHDRHPGFRAR